MASLMAAISSGQFGKVAVISGCFSRKAEAVQKSVSKKSNKNCNIFDIWKDKKSKSVHD
jgi:enterochelin esterase-like enzyme